KKKYVQSIIPNMIKVHKMANSSARNAEFAKASNLSGYPIYPEDEDVYIQWKEEKELNPEEITQLKTSNENAFENDLDVPGSELDDKQEAIGSEDEENNYYSIGGDAHDNLHEN
ncbi:MAG: hypothetical protein WCJ03_01325, partial [Bacteroidales bacterium]